MRNVKVYEEAWPLHTPFVISRGSRSEASVVVVEIEEDDIVRKHCMRLERVC